MVQVMSKLLARGPRHRTCTIYIVDHDKMLNLLTCNMSHVDQSTRQCLRHMNNGNQGKSRNDRVTWHIIVAPQLFNLHVLFFLIPFLQRLCLLIDLLVSISDTTTINCIQRRLGWGAVYRTIIPHHGISNIYDFDDRSV